MSKAVFLCVAICSTMLAASPVLADDPTPAAIFQNHAKAVGYSLSDGRSKPFIMDSTASWYDYKNVQHSSDAVLSQAGSIYREDVTYAGSTDSTGFDGTAFWRSSDNGNLTPDTGYSRPFDVTWAVINSEGYDDTFRPRCAEGQDRRTSCVFILRTACRQTSISIARRGSSTK